MIGKISMGHGAAGIISYCYYGEKGKVDSEGEEIIRGELLYSNEIFESRQPNGHLHIKQIAAQFHQLAALNENVGKFIWHQSFSFPPGEQISNETMIKIAQDFAKEFGFEDNQYMVFRHRDTPHEHFHIIANRINADGENTATDQHNYERIQIFCRKMENKYKLQKVENHALKLDGKHNRHNHQLDRIRKTIDFYLGRCQTLSALSIALKKKGIVMHLGRGVSFTDQRTGISFKGSDLGRAYSRQHIEKNLGKNVNQYQPVNRTGFDGVKREELRRIIDRLVLQTTPKQNAVSRYETNAMVESWKNFENQLQAEGIKLRLVRRKTQEGTIVAGVTFQMENAYISGRELGEKYTVKALNLRFGRSPEEFEKYFRELSSPTLPDKEFKESSVEQSFVAHEPVVRLIHGSNGAEETKKDLAKIEESLRTHSTKRQRKKRLT